jgi:hypothetical protein
MLPDKGRRLQASLEAAPFRGAFFEVPASLASSRRSQGRQGRTS